MPTVPFSTLLATNLRVARAAADLSQGDVGERMQSLGFTAWMRSTMSLVEHSKRRVTAEELLGLAVALETTIEELIFPRDDGRGLVALPNGRTIPGLRIAVDDESVRWKGNELVISEQAEPLTELRRANLRGLRHRLAMVPAAQAFQAITDEQQ